MGFAKREGCGGVIMWNAAALISTDPRGLLRDPDPVGDHNDLAIRAAVGRPKAVCIAAWGKPVNKRIAALVTRAQLLACALQTHHRIGPPTKDGWPRHPLYLRADTPLEEL